MTAMSTQPRKHSGALPSQRVGSGDETKTYQEKKCTNEYDDESLPVLVEELATLIPTCHLDGRLQRDNHITTCIYYKCLNSECILKFVRRHFIERRCYFKWGGGGSKKI